MDKAEQRRWWRTAWLTRIQELSDLEMQKAIRRLAELCLQDLQVA